MLTELETSGQHGAFRPQEEPIRLSFTGSKDGIPVNEFLARFDKLAKLRNWTASELPGRLHELTTMGAWEVLDNIITKDQTPEEVFMLYTKNLKTTYGVSSQQAFSMLCQKRKSTEESINQYAIEILDLTKLVFPDPIMSEIAAVKYFWEGSVIQSYSAYTTANPEQTSLQNAVQTCQTYWQETNGDIIMYHKDQEMQAKNVKFNQNYKLSKSEDKQIEKPKYSKCKFCKKNNHKAENCFFNPKNKKRKAHEKKSEVFRNQCLPLYKNFLVDTGATSSVIVLDDPDVPTISKIIKTINGECKVHCTTGEYKVLETLLSNVIIKKGPWVIYNTNIKGILGLDYIRARGGMALSFDSDTPHVTFADTCLTSVSVPEQKEYDYPDFILRKIEQPNKTFIWEYEMKWIHEPIQGQTGPSKYSLKLSSEDYDLFLKELDLWKEQGFITPIEDEKNINKIPLLAAIQKHKLSTQVRPVMDYSHLNEYIISKPNLDIDKPISAPTFIRRWRANSNQEMCLIDIKKAYMQIRCCSE
jgi:hypothetical protein